MYYLIKFVLKLLLVFLIIVFFNVFCFLELIFLFSQKKTNKLWIFINEIYYKNPEKNGTEKEGSRVLAKNCNIIDWLKDYKERYNLYSYNTDYNSLDDY